MTFVADPTRTILSASLRINGFSVNGVTPLRFSTFAGDLTTLVASNNSVAVGGSIFRSLGTGTTLGTGTVRNTSGFEEFRNFTFDLNAAALNAHIASVGSTFAIAMTSTASVTNTSNSHYFASFASYILRGNPVVSSGQGAITLELTYAPVTVVPLPPAAWAGLSTLAGIGCIGVIRRRRMQA